MSLISGTRGAGNGLAANQQVDVWKTLMLVEPYNTPVMQYTFMGNKPAKPVYNPQGKYSWMEDEFPGHIATTTANVTASSGTLTLTSGTHLSADDFALFRTDDLVIINNAANGDQMGYVSAKTSTKVTFTATSGSLSDVAKDDTIHILSNFNSEDASKISGLDTVESEVYNYLTIMSDTVGMTGREEAGRHYSSGLSFAEKLQKKQKEMKLRFERLALLSLNAGKTSATMVKSWGRGALGTFTTNLTDYGSALSLSSLDTFMKNIGAKGSTRRTIYAGTNVYYAIQSIVRDKIGSLPSVVKGAFGVNIMTVYYGDLELTLIKDPVLDGKYTDYALGVDLDRVVGRYMANDGKGSRKFRIEMNTQTPGDDIQEAKVLMDLGVQFMNESTGGWLMT